MKEIINGWLVDHDNEPFMKVMKEFIDNELGAGSYDKDTDIDLLVLDKSTKTIEVTNYGVSISDKEYRFINEDDIDRVASDEADEYYDQDMWKDAVTNDDTISGYEDWLQEVIDELQYGEFFATYDGKEEYIEDWYYFRIN